MESDLSLEFLRVVEQAAIACAHTMGQGDRHRSDQAAVRRCARSSTPSRSTAPSSSAKGERDEAPMLYIGEKVGMAHKTNGATPQFDEVDIAVDPLEGTNLCATGEPNAIAVLAASEQRRLAARARRLHGEARGRARAPSTWSTSTRRCATTCGRSRAASAVRSTS